MTVRFHVVRCPADQAVVLEIMVGASRGKCPVCKRRVWAMCDGEEVTVGMVDMAPKRVADSG